MARRPEDRPGATRVGRALRSQCGRVPVGFPAWPGPISAPPSGRWPRPLVSTAAVSYALRGKHVSKETEERVRKAAAELGYEADPIARALASGRTSMVGVLAGDLQDLWQQQLMAAIGRELLAGDRYALILDAGGDPDRELKLAKQLRDQRVDALLVSPVNPSAEEWAAIADALPVVAVGDSLSTARTAGQVIFDNRAGIDSVLEYLYGLGHRRVTVLTPTRPSTPDRPADVYVREAAERLGLRAELVPCPQELGEATVVARRLLDGPRPATAVFCFSDSLAYGCMPPPPRPRCPSAGTSRWSASTTIPCPGSSPRR